MVNERFIEGATYTYTNKDLPLWVGVKLRAQYRIDGTDSARFTLLSLPKKSGYMLGDEVGFPLYNVKLYVDRYSDWVKRMKL